MAIKEIIAIEKTKSKKNNHRLHCMFLSGPKTLVFVSLGYSSEKEIEKKGEETWKDTWMAF